MILAQQATAASAPLEAVPAYAAPLDDAPQVHRAIEEVIDETPKVEPRRRRSLSGWIGLVFGALVVLIVVALAGFRLAAALRETAGRETFAPTAGQFVDTTGGKVFLQDAGPRDGIPVVLIHGTAAWSEFWRGTIDHLVAERYRVIAIDLPPFGFSDRSPSGAYSRAHQAERIAGVLEVLKIDKAIFVGHSFGAGATVETVIRHPERVRGLVLVAAALGLPQPGETPAPPSSALMTFLGMPVLPEVLIAATATNPLLTQKLLGMMVARKEAATPELAAVLQRPMTRTGTTRDFVVWARAFLMPDLGAVSMNPDVYPLIGVKTRLIWGDLDTLTPLDQGVRLAKLIPAAKLSLLRGVGHIPQVEDPDYFRPVLSRLLAEVK